MLCKNSIAVLTEQRVSIEGSFSESVALEFSPPCFISAGKVGEERVREDWKGGCIVSVCYLSEFELCLCELRMCIDELRM